MIQRHKYHDIYYTIIADKLVEINLPIFRNFFHFDYPYNYFKVGFYRNWIPHCYIITFCKCLNKLPHFSNCYTFLWDYTIFMFELFILIFQILVYFSNVLISNL